MAASADDSKFNEQTNDLEPAEQYYGGYPYGGGYRQGGYGGGYGHGGYGGYGGHGGYGHGYRGGYGHHNHY